MTDLNFYVDFAQNGTIAGVGVGATPDQTEEILGGGFIDDVNRHGWRRDFGLIEFYFLEEADWTCRWISIQAHRLGADVDNGELIPSVLLKRYGRFAPTIDFTRLHEELTRRGVHVENIDDPRVTDFKIFWIDEGHITVHVDGDAIWRLGTGR